ncbi:hypothetical protein MUP01_08775 [Candidatus Bathyarchaeota archaeon]|nr:hypothetical protein [Candidatus Bathyarchaeota archaeon]
MLVGKYLSKVSPTKAQSLIMATFIEESAPDIKRYGLLWKRSYFKLYAPKHQGIRTFCSYLCVLSVCRELSSNTSAHIEERHASTVKFLIEMKVRDDQRMERDVKSAIQALCNTRHEVKKSIVLAVFIVTDQSYR